SVYASVQAADVDGDGRTDLVGHLPFETLPVFVNQCDASVFARSFVVPVVLRNRGVGGTLFTSELVLTNRGSSDVSVDLTYTAAFGGGGGSASLPLPRGHQVVLKDAI